MSENEYTHHLPDLKSIAELFPGCTLFSQDSLRQLKGIHIYHGGLPRDGYLYLIQEDDGFPRDSAPWISNESLTGSADHILVSNVTRDEILDTILCLFADFSDQERALNDLLFRNASLQELCDEGAALLNNPVYLHDDWFIMVARSKQVDDLLPPEYVMSSQKGFLPKMIIDDLKDDTDYLETYSYRTVQRWENRHGACLYGNLWDGSIYRGRLIVAETTHPFLHKDYLLTQALTQKALMLMMRKQLGESPLNRSMDDIMFELLNGKQPDAASLMQLMNMLHWNKDDKFICIRIQNQQSDIPEVISHALHSDLFRTFPDGYILLSGHQQCVILNQTRGGKTIPHIHHALAPLCMEYCLYAGISSPVLGIRDLPLGYYQADVALNQAFRLHNEKWILSFWECALDHLVNKLDSPLQPWHLTSPDLHILAEYDKLHGTSYFETLKQYLLLERDIPKVSETLIIHRTTLLYRLKKIQAMISTDLNDCWQRLYLLFSIWILEKDDVQK